MNRRQYIKLRNRRNRRLLFLFMLWITQEVNRQYWVHPINLLHEEKGEFYTLYPDLRHFRNRFIGMYRMDVDEFEELLQKVTPYLKKRWTYMRAPISPEQQLVITLT